MIKCLFRVLATCCMCLIFTPAQAFVISFEASDFGLNPTFSNVQNFEITIDIAGPLTAGTVYIDPALNGVDYGVNGILGATPSGFPAFNLVRSIGGAEFYSQGSSMSFEVSAAADLTDGLQVSELVGTDPVFLFNAREFSLTPGRYHPPLFQLNADGTGSIRNSNNMGGLNPDSGLVVDVEAGDEYITELTFNANNLTLAGATAVPEPAVGLPLMMLGVAGLWALRRRPVSAARP